MTTFLSAEAALRWVTMLAACDVLFRSASLLGQREQLRDGGVFGWDVARAESRWAHERGLLSRVVDTLLAYPAVLSLIDGRLVASLLLILYVQTVWVAFWSIAFIYATNLLLLEIRTYVASGSDVMTRIVFGALLLERLSGGHPLATEACLWFLVLMSLLSYVGNGRPKLNTPSWRSGKALLEIAGNPAFGSPAAARVLARHPRWCRVLTWHVVAVELLFPLVLLTGYPGCWLFLGWGLLFHLFNAVFLGLGPFFWIFIAPYPAILYAALVSQYWLSS